MNLLVTIASQTSKRTASCHTHSFTMSLIRTPSTSTAIAGVTVRTDMKETNTLPAQGGVCVAFGDQPPFFFQQPPR